MLTRLCMPFQNNLKQQKCRLNKLQYFYYLHTLGFQYIVHHEAYTVRSLKMRHIASYNSWVKMRSSSGRVLFE